VAAGREVTARFTWQRSAERHLAVYAALDRGAALTA